MEDGLKYLANFLNSIDDYLTTICEIPLDKQQTTDNSELNNSNKENFPQASSISKVITPCKPIEYKIFKFSTFHSKERRLKQYRFRYFKRENIDKRLISSLKSYISKNSNRFKSTFIDEFRMNVYSTPCVVDNELKFNSMNYKYIKWLYSHKEIRDVLQEFVNDELDQFVKSMASNYGVSYKDDLRCLRAYIIDYTCLYK